MSRNGFIRLECIVGSKCQVVREGRVTSHDTGLSHIALARGRNVTGMHYDRSQIASLSSCITLKLFMH